MAAEFIKNRVSIVTPVLNGEEYISRMLDSVLGQSYKDLEMILVDGGSSDGTLIIAEEYRKKFREEGMEYHVVKGYGNAAAGMNQGFPLVRGEFLIWPDGDDVLEKESIAKRVDFLQRHPQYQCVRSLGYYVQEGTEEKAAPEEKTGDLANENLFFSILFADTFVCCGCYMFRTERFFEIYPERKIPESDVGRNFQMLLPFTYRYPCPTIREELYRVYKRPGSMSRLPLTEEQKRKKQVDLEALVDSLVKICQITDRKEMRRIEAWRAKMRCNLYRELGKGWKAAAALLQMYLNGGLSIWGFVRNEIYILGGGMIFRIKRFIRKE